MEVDWLDVKNRVNSEMSDDEKKRIIFIRDLATVGLKKARGEQ